MHMWLRLFPGKLEGASACSTAASQEGRFIRCPLSPGAKLDGLSWDGAQKRSSLGFRALECTVHSRGKQKPNSMDRVRHSCTRDCEPGRLVR